MNVLAQEVRMTSSRQGMYCMWPTVILPLQWCLQSTRGPYFYLMVIILSPFLSFCLSTSMWAPVTSWMAVILQPPRPMIRDTTEAGTDSFFDLQKKADAFHYFCVCTSDINKNVSTSPHSKHEAKIFWIRAQSWFHLDLSKHFGITFGKFLTSTL